MPEKNESPLLASATKVTLMCDISKAHLYALLKEKRFPEPALRLGSRWVRWRVSDIEAWVANPQGFHEAQAKQSAVKA